MHPNGEERRLTTILSADVVGYSRLMGEDEAGTFRALNAYREELVEPRIAVCGGRIVKLMGDGMLVEFASVVEAVECAVEIQRGIAERNTGIPAVRRIQLRIGINIGDVIVHGDDIYGDGVNVAARLEGLAEPGGICVSRPVRNQVRDKLLYGFDDLGEKEVKNISRPVRVFRVNLEGQAPGKTGTVKAQAKRTWPRYAVAAAVVIVLAVGGWLVWIQPWVPDNESGAPGPMAASEATVPSIAVLPFDNMSGDSEMDYFADGITEDIITELSRFPELLVIARNSSFTYKGKPVKVQQVAKEFAVRYVLEGSVRRSGDKVRIAAQLIDATTGHHVWAERFDEEGGDVFTLQDEVTTRIIASIAGERGKIREADYKHAWGRGAASLSEYDYFLRIHSLIYRFNKEDMARARAIALEGLQRFPDSSLLKIKLGWCLFHEAHKWWSEDPARDYERAFKLANEGVADRNLPPIAEWHGRWLLSFLYLWYKKDVDRAFSEAEATIALVPTDSETLVTSSRTLLFAGKPDEALVWLDKAIGRTPIVPEWFNIYFGWARYLKGDYEKAREHLEKITWPDVEGTRLRAATYVKLGLMKEARAAADDLNKVFPNLTLAALKEWLPYKHEADLEREIADLRKAGIPE